MKKKIGYTDEPMDDVEAVVDFLPSPAELALREDGVKVTLTLSKSSVAFFKSEASKPKKRMTAKLGQIDGERKTRRLTTHIAYIQCTDDPL